MSKKTSQASSQYLNIRNQNKNEILEDYVEAIQEISELKGDVKNADLAEHFGVSQATINKNLKRLINFNLAKSEPYRSIFLTKEGKKLAQISKEKHGIVYNFLIKKLGLADSAELDAGIEEVMERIGKSERKKYRAVVYYMLVKKFDKESVYGM